MKEHKLVFSTDNRTDNEQFLLETYSSISINRPPKIYNNIKSKVTKQQKSQYLNFIKNGQTQILPHKSANLNQTLHIQKSGNKKSSIKLLKATAFEKSNTAFKKKQPQHLTSFLKPLKDSSLFNYNMLQIKKYQKKKKFQSQIYHQFIKQFRCKSPSKQKLQTTRSTSNTILRKERKHSLIPLQSLNKQQYKHCQSSQFTNNRKQITNLDNRSNQYFIESFTTPIQQQTKYNQQFQKRDFKSSSRHLLELPLQFRQILYQNDCNKKSYKFIFCQEKEKGIRDALEFKSAIKIQSFWRGYILRKHFKLLAISEIYEPQQIFIEKTSIKKISLIASIISNPEEIYSRLSPALFQKTLMKLQQISKQQFSQSQSTIEKCATISQDILSHLIIEFITVDDIQMNLKFSRLYKFNNSSVQNIVLQVQGQEQSDRTIISRDDYLKKKNHNYLKEKFVNKLAY